MMSNLFFKPHVGKNHNGRLVLLATIDCPHCNDCFNVHSKERFEDCTIKGNSKNYNTDCIWRDSQDGKYINLEDTVNHNIKKYIRKEFSKYDEESNTSLTKLSNAISLAIYNKEPKNEQERSVIWENFICTELCQHFIPHKKTKESDFGITNDFEAVLEIIHEYEIKRILILGKPSWYYLQKAVSKYYPKISFIHTKLQTNEPNIDHYWHQMKITGIRTIDLLYSWHPSYSLFYDGSKEDSKLIKWLKKFFDTNQNWSELKEWHP